MFPPLLIIFTVNHEVLHSSIIFEVPFCIALFNHHDVRMKLLNEKLSIAFYFSKKPQGPQCFKVLHYDCRKTHI